VWLNLRLFLFIIRIFSHGSSHWWAAHTRHTAHSFHTWHSAHTAHSSHLLHQLGHVHAGWHTASTTHAWHTAHTSHSWHTAHASHTWHTAHASGHAAATAHHVLHLTLIITHIVLFLFITSILINPSTPIDSNFLIFNLILHESWPPLFLLLVFLRDIKSDVSTLKVPLAISLNDLLEHDHFKRELLVFGGSTNNKILHLTKK
jgi:hypothetical protein